MNKLHYPTLEYCYKLKEIGFPDTIKHYKDNGFTEICDTGTIPCPSIAEMLEQMPKYINGHPLKIDYGTGQGFYSTYCYVMYGTMHTTWLDLPNALVLMIIWLVENKHLSFNE